MKRENLTGFAIFVLLGALALIMLVQPSPNPPCSVTVAPTPAILVPPGNPIPAEELAEVYAGVITSDTELEARTLGRIAVAGDTRFVPVYIDLLRFTRYPPYVTLLERLTGEAFGDNWFAWVEWYGETDINPPPGYAAWKAEAYGLIHEPFATLLAPDNVAAGFDYSDVTWGGAYKDSIPALDQPAYLTPPQAAAYMTPDEPVFGVVVNGEARAYPLRIMDWHEMANDTLGGVDFSLAYCTLCGSGIAYHIETADGETLTFGSSGLLYRSNKLMYDRQTDTVWNHLTGEPVVGPLVGTDVRVAVLPLVLTRWADWVAQHPRTTVVDINTGYERDYSLGAAYGHYFETPFSMFPVSLRSDALPEKVRVYTILLNGTPVAYPLPTLQTEGVVNDRVGGQGVVLVAQRGSVQVDGQSRLAGPVSYSAGAEVRAFASDGRTFNPGNTPEAVIDAEGGLWTVTEDALVGPDGETLPRLNGGLAYWFGWYAFYPNTVVYGQ